MDYESHQKKVLAWYVSLAKVPAWRQYVWARVQQMARECPDLYATLPADLTAAMKQQLETTK